MTNGKIILLKEGQFLTGRKALSKDTGIPESTIEDILRFYESEQQIRQQKTTKYRLITILNWKDHQESDSKATTNRQQADTIKNEKKEKNTSPSDEVRVVLADEEGNEVFKPEKKVSYTATYNELCDWMENLTGVKMVDRRGQYKALKLAREAGISRDRLIERAEQMWDSSKYDREGMDWFTVVYSFNKKA